MCITNTCVLQIQIRSLGFDVVPVKHHTCITDVVHGTAGCVETEVYLIVIYFAK